MLPPTVSPPLPPGPHGRPPPAATLAPAPTPSPPPPASPPAPASTSHGRAPSSPIPLSPDAEPFFPSGIPGGRGKRLRWRDDYHSSDGEDGDDAPSYRDVLLQPISAAAPTPIPDASPPTAANRPQHPHPQAARPAHDRLGPREEARSGRHRQRRRGQTRLIHGLPHRRNDSTDGTINKRLRSVVILPQREPSPPPCDADGFTKVRSRRSARRRRQRRAHAQEQRLAKPAPPRIPVVLAGRCFNCLSLKHRVAQCRLPTRCLRCHGLRHLARDCKRPRCPSSFPSSEADGGRCLGRDASLPTTTGNVVHGSTPPPPVARRSARSELSHQPDQPGRARGSATHPRASPQQRAASSRRHQHGQSHQDAPRCAAPKPLLAPSVGMDAEEERLHCALQAVVPGDHGEISVEALRCAIQDLPDAGGDSSLVRRLAPGTFLVIFASQHASNATGGDTASPVMPPELAPGTSSPATASSPAVEVVQAVQASETLTRSIPTVGKAGGDTVLLTVVPVPAVVEANPTTKCLSDEETDNQGKAPVVSLELVAFDEQCPARSGHESQAMDPMLFEISEPVPKLIHQPTPAQEDNGGLQLKMPVRVLKTYSRRPRSVAAQSSNNSAALQSPTAFFLEPSVEPSSSERQQLCVLRNEPDSELAPLEEEPATELSAQDTQALPMVGSPTSRRPRRGESATKRAKTQPNPSLEEAKAATAAFLASVSQALQVPLATLPGRGGRNVAVPGTTTPATPVRRSARLANEVLNSTVRASKKGEVLVMRKLGLCPEDPTAGQPRQELAAVFKGPLDASSFAALRDIFPAANALTDADLMALGTQLTGAISVC
ncbi:unnamed protein product [Urochloa humidicola]